MKKVLIIILITLTIIFSVYFIFRKPIENEEQAIKIAKKYVHFIYRNDFSEYSINADLKGKKWIVYYHFPDEEDEDGNVICWLDGGGPEVHIRKADGIMTFCRLQG